VEKPDLMAHSEYNTTSLLLSDMHTLNAVGQTFTFSILFWW